MKIRTYLKVAIKQLRQRLLIFFSKEGQGNISVVARDICIIYLENCVALSAKFCE